MTAPEPASPGFPRAAPSTIISHSFSPSDIPNLYHEGAFYQHLRTRCDLSQLFDWRGMAAVVIIDRLADKTRSKNTQGRGDRVLRSLFKPTFPPQSALYNKEYADNSGKD